MPAILNNESKAQLPIFPKNPADPEESTQEDAKLLSLTKLNRFIHVWPVVGRPCRAKGIKLWLVKWA
jgi:hypothetical protein